MGYIYTMITDFLQRLCLRFMAVNDDTLVRDVVIGEMAAPEAGGTLLDVTVPPRSSLEPKTPQEEGHLCVVPGVFSKLPAEIIDHVLSFLSPRDLNAIAATCHRLSEHGQKDLAWYRHVQDSIPGCLVKSPSPCATYRELYGAHGPYWFLPKYKVWFSDYFLTGKLIIIRYDPRRGCIEGYRLVAERKITEFEPWEFDDEVIIHSFEPKVLLHRDLPVLQLDVPKSTNSPQSQAGTPKSGFNFEIPMHIHDVSRRGTFANLVLARAIEERPYMALWPPQTIPAKHRVRNASQGNFVATGHKPQRWSDISDQTFRIRRWMQMVGGSNQPGVRLAEEVHTYSTIDPYLYTPTADKPYRGIWVGDYAGHGCEFLLIHQPDDEVPFDESSVMQRNDESTDEFLLRKQEERVYRGRIEAIKLTGDPNVPRGEYTFIADDIGGDGFVRVAHEAKFRGARIVKSKGHVAERLFTNDTYIDSQLIMISPDKLAQFWVGFGHISFFERVRIDEFTSPYNDKPYERPLWTGGLT